MSTAKEFAVASRFRLLRATRSQWSSAQEWMAREGWDPGIADDDTLFRLHPGGFFLGLLDGHPVSALSVVNYGPRVAFAGNYLVRAEQRGRGLESATWRTAIGHAGTRAIGLEAVPDLVPWFDRAGFT